MHHLVLADGRTSSVNVGGRRLQREFLLPDTKGDHPLITVITVVFNNARGLRRLIESVRSQSYRNFEHIVVDGGSSDGSAAVLRENSATIDYWISERDEGVYSAMNKAISLSSGRYICFINADDRFIRNTALEEFAGVITKATHPQALYYADVEYETGEHFRSALSLKTLVINTIHHQGAFYQRQMFESFRYDEQMLVAADYELNLLIYLRRLPSTKLPSILTICGAAGISKTLPQLTISKENHFVRSRHMNPMLSFIFFLLARLNVARRRIWSRND